MKSALYRAFLPIPVLAMMACVNGGDGVDAAAQQYAAALNEMELITVQHKESIDQSADTTAIEEEEAAYHSSMVALMGDMTVLMEEMQACGAYQSEDFFEMMSAMSSELDAHQADMHDADSLEDAADLEEVHQDHMDDYMAGMSSMMGQEGGMMDMHCSGGSGMMGQDGGMGDSSGNMDTP